MSDEERVRKRTRIKRRAKEYMEYLYKKGILYKSIIGREMDKFRRERDGDDNND